MLSRKEQTLLEALETCAQNRGVEIVSVEVVGAKKSPTIRVYVDTESGVTFDDLTAAQEWINELMDKLDPFPGAYTLEVSSPGIDRPLRTVAHFQKYVGQMAYACATEAVDGRKAWTGTILSCTDETLMMQVDGLDYAIPFSLLKRANLKGTVDFSS